MSHSESKDVNFKLFKYQVLTLFDFFKLAGTLLMVSTYKQAKTLYCTVLYLYTVVHENVPLYILTISPTFIGGFIYFLH